MWFSVCHIFNYYLVRVITVDVRKWLATPPTMRDYVLVHFSVCNAVTSIFHRRNDLNAFLMQTTAGLTLRSRYRYISALLLLSGVIRLKNYRFLYVVNNKM